MNFVMRIALSLSIITLIAQPVRAASYTDHAKKAAKITWHLSKIAGAVFALKLCKSTLQEIVKLNGNAHYLNSRKDLLDQIIHRPNNTPKSSTDSELNLCNEQIQLQKSTPKILALNGAISGATSFALLYNGIKGLKKEICPNFNPITWIKVKLGKKTQKTA